MTLKISQISNSYLRDIATIVDNGNGIIEEAEISIFSDKVKEMGVLEAGVCSKNEYAEIVETINKNTPVVEGQGQNPNVQSAYLEELNAEIDKELKIRNLVRDDENIKIVTEIIKNKKELNIQIKVQEAKIEKIKEKANDPFFVRKMWSTIAGIVPTGIAGAAIGFKVGAAFGPAGMVIGAIVGNGIGALIGGFGGYTIGEATIPEEDKKNVQQEYDKEILVEKEKLKKLYEEYEKLN